MTLYKTCRASDPGQEISMAAIEGRRAQADFLAKRRATETSVAADCPVNRALAVGRIQSDRR